MSDKPLNKISRQEAKQAEEAKKAAVKAARAAREEAKQREAREAKQAGKAKKAAIKAARAAREEARKKEAGEAKQADEAKKAAVQTAKLAQEEAKKKESVEAKKAPEKAAVPAAEKVPGRDGWSRSLFARNIVSVYVDDTSIKLMKVRGKRIEKCATLDLEPGLVSNGIVLNPAAVAARLQTLIKDNGVKETKVIVGLSGLHSISRLITLPYIPAKTRAEAVQFEAERELPVPLGTVYLSWQVIKVTTQEIQILLVAYARNAIDALEDTFRRAGINPYIMDLTTLALTRVVNKPTAAIFDIRSTELDIVIMTDGFPEFTRSLPLPADRGWEDKLPIIREEIGRTIKFYQPAKPFEPGLPVFGSGDFPDSEKLFEVLSAELGYTIMPVLPPLQYPDKLHLRSYAVNTGLALKKVSLKDKAYSRPININLLPGIYLPQKRATRILLPVAAAAATGLLVFGLIAFLNALAYTSSLKSQLINVNLSINKIQTEQITQKRAIADLESKVQSQVKVRDQFRAVLDGFSDSRKEISGDFETILSALNKNIQLKHILHGSGLTIDGKAPAPADVIKYIRTLNESKRFSEVVISRMSTVIDQASKAPIVSFTLDLKKGG